MKEFDKHEELEIDVGDFVKVVGSDGKLFVVTEVYDYSEDGEIDISYDVIQIFPIKTNWSELSYDYGDVILHSKLNSNQYQTTFSYIKKVRLERNLREMPIFMDNFEIVDREVDYSSGETVDDCLDMLNNLDFLYDTFGDKEYKENKNIVMKRLEELTKEKKKKK